jgi:predicted RNA polymerase sigma factor
LLQRAGQCEAAIEQYRRAAEQTTSLPERRYLLERADQLSRRL